jgi:class 3 adenylate cyclase
VLLLDPLESLQRLAADAQERTEDGNPNVTIVAIDEQALDLHGRLSDWGATRHADVIANLSEAGANVIIYDVLFGHRSADGDILWTPWEWETPLREAIFAAKYQDPPTRVILAAVGQGAPSLEDDGVVYETIVGPFDRLLIAGAIPAVANLITGDDGRVRHIPTVVLDGQGGVRGLEGFVRQEALPSMALAAAYGGRDVPQPIPLEGDNLDVLGVSVPLEEGQTMRINYVGGSDRFTTIPFNDALDGTFDPSLVEGHVVIVGLLASAADVHSVPLLGSAHGVEVHANALHTLLSARFLEPVADWVTFLTSVVFVFAAALVVPRLRLLFTFLGLIGVIVVYVLAGNVLYHSGQIIDFVDPPLALALATVAALVYREASERASQREMQDLFGSMVTILFTDVEGSTALTDRLGDARARALLREHERITREALKSHGGAEVKTMGDGFMTSFSSATKALECAIAMQRAFEERNTGHETRDTEIKVRIGLNAGEPIAEDDPEGRADLFGTAVNMAARIAAKADGGEVLASNVVRELVAGKGFLFNDRGDTELRGFEDPVRLYEVRWRAD